MPDGRLQTINGVVRIIAPVKVPFGRFEGGEEASYWDNQGEKFQEEETRRVWTSRVEGMW